jgi:hypothetical protein
VSEKHVEEQINSQTGIKSGASGADWKLMTINEETPFGFSMTDIFC